MNRHFSKEDYVHEKMLNIANHLGNANQKHNEVSPHTGYNDYHQKDKR